MKHLFACLLLCTVITAGSAQARLISSDAFDLPAGEIPLAQFAYDTPGIVSISIQMPYKFTFRLFSPEMQLTGEKKSDLKGMTDIGWSLHNMVQLKDRTYCFFINYQDKSRSEGISVLEFLPDALEFADKGQDLFQSAKKIRTQSAYPTMNAGRSTDEQVSLSPYSAAHGLYVSGDRTKFMCTYELVEEDMKEGFARTKAGLYVFGQDLEKLWGGEYAMPYAKEKMAIADRLLGNDGKAYFLAKVYNRSNKKEQTDGRPDFHYEVLVYEKGEPAPDIIALDAEEKFPMAHRFFEAPGGVLVFAGISSAGSGEKMQSQFMYKIQTGSNQDGRVKKWYYTLPESVVHSFGDTKEGAGGLENIELREVLMHADGAVDMVLEQYSVFLRSDKFNSRGGDVYIVHIGADGVMNWAKKIPKAQEHPAKVANSLSFATSLFGNDLYLFYYDHPGNFNLSADQAPVVLENIAEGELIGVRIDAKGEVEKFSVNVAGQQPLGIRYFNVAGKNSMLRVERQVMLMLRVD